MAVQEAAVASMAVHQAVGQLKDSFNAIIGTLKAGFEKMKGIVESTVAAFRPFEVEMYRRALLDLNAVFGQALMPIVKSVTAVVRDLANFFFSLSDATKSIIAVIAKWTIIIGGATAALTGIAALFAAIVAPIAAVALAFAPLLLMLSPILVPLGLLVTVLGAFGAALVAFNWGKIVDGVGKVFDTLVAVAEAIWQQIEPYWQQLEEAFGELGDALGELFDAVKPALAIQLVLIGSAIAVAIKIVVTSLTLFVNALTLMATAVARIAKALSFGLIDIDLPSMGPKKSAFGLGQHGGSVTSLEGAFKTMQEEVLKNAGGDTKTKEDQALENSKKTAENTSKLVELMGGEEKSKEQVNAYNWDRARYGY